MLSGVGSTLAGMTTPRPQSLLRRVVRRLLDHDSHLRTDSECVVRRRTLGAVAFLRVQQEYDGAADPDDDVAASA